MSLAECPDTGRRAVAGLVATALVAFAMVAGAAWVVAHRIARTDALAEAVRTAHGVGQSVFAPALPAVLDGDRSASAALDAAVATRRQDGTLVRVTVWRADGTVLWSDDHTLIGRRFPLDRRVAAVLGRRADFADISAPAGAQPADGQHADGQLRSGRLVEAYIPLTISGGRTVALQMYVPDTRERQAEDELGDRIVPFALLSLLVLALAQLPVSIGLVRRAVRAQRDRDRMLEQVLVSAERERRQLARTLDDGVVQELAAAADLLDSGRPAEVPPGTRRAMGLVSRTLHRTVGDLRDLLVDLHPHELTSDTLADLIAASTVRACPDARVGIDARLDRPVPLETATFLYRCARECAVNVAKHAVAGRVDIVLRSDATGVRLVVRDDGLGIPPGALDRDDGHLGLSLLRQAAADLGGALRVDGAHGTTVTVTLPAVPAGARPAALPA